MIGDIPDLRLPGPCWINREADFDEAQKLLEQSKTIGLEELIRGFFRSREGWDEKRVELRTRQIMGARLRLRGDVDGWLSHFISPSGIFLDLGCGAGTLLAAAAGKGFSGAGIDVSLSWLVIAQKMVQEAGGKPILAAAMAESIPLSNDTLCGVVSLDVIEHVGNQSKYIDEIHRVIRPGGGIALTTPNRFSLTAEPHVFVWGVGWLPRSLQKKYVMWRSGQQYEYTSLLSMRETRRMLRKYQDLEFKIVPGEVSQEEISRFPPRRALFARMYNRLLNFSLLRRAFLAIGPFFLVIGRKSG